MGIEMVLAVALLLEHVVIGYVVWFLFQENRRINSFSMSKDDSRAFVTMENHDKWVPTPTDVHNSKVRQSMKEFNDIYLSGEIDSDQEAKYAIKEKG